MRSTNSSVFDFSFIVPTCHRNDLLEKCLERLAAEVQQADDISYEVIVTDDGSKSTAEKLIASDYPWVKWTAGPRRGPAANRNHGAAQSSAEWLIFADDDCLPDTNLLRAYLAVIQQNPLVNVFEGRIYPERPARTCAEFAPINELGGYLWSCNFAIRRAIFQKLKGFDERFPYACMEDVDFHQRIKTAGLTVMFCWEAAVCHPWRKTDAQREYRIQSESSAIYQKLHPEDLDRFSLNRQIFALTRGILKDTIPALWRYRGAGASYAFAKHLNQVKSVLRTLLGSNPV